MGQIYYECSNDAVYYLKEIVKESLVSDKNITITKNKVKFKNGGDMNVNGKNIIESILSFILKNGKIIKLKKVMIVKANFLYFYRLIEGNIHVESKIFHPYQEKKYIEFEELPKKLLKGRVIDYQKWTSSFENKLTLNDYFWEAITNNPILNLLKPIFFHSLYKSGERKSTNVLILRTNKYQLNMKTDCSGKKYWYYTPVILSSEKNFVGKNIYESDEVILKDDRRKVKIDNQFLSLNEFIMKRNFNVPVYLEGKEIGNTCDFCVYRLHQVTGGKCKNCNPKIKK